MDLCNGSCSSGRPSVLRGKHFIDGHYTQTFQSHLFVPAMCIGNIDSTILYQLCDLDHAWGSQGQRKAEISWLPSLAYFSIDEDKI